MRRIGSNPVGAFSAAVLLVLAGIPAALAAEGTTKQQMISMHAAAVAAAAASTDAPTKHTPRPYYGTADGSTLNIHAYDFQGMTPFSDNILDDGNGFRYWGTASGSRFMAAPVTGLPSGVVVDYIEVSDCIGAANDFTIGLWETPYGSGSSSGTSVAFISTVTGCGTDGAYSLGYMVPSNSGHPLWILLYWPGAVDGSTIFNDVTIGYHRVVSPAPGSPTFGDVPLSDPGFQYIEALVSSGITAGCGGGNYCPDNPLTRRQMAVFLSKAFGLHWPN